MNKKKVKINEIILLKKSINLVFFQKLDKYNILYNINYNY